jgi:hypothetical protein
MKWERNFNNLVGTTSYPQKFDDLKDIITYIIDFFSGSTMILDTRELNLKYMFQRKRKLILIISRGFSRTGICINF